MREWIITFVSVLVINILYTRYLKAVQKNLPFVASSWSASITIISGIVAINYINNHWLLIPSCLGSFAGTYISMKTQ